MMTQETGFFTKLQNPMQCFYENPVSAFGAGLLYLRNRVFR